MTNKDLKETIKNEVGPLLIGVRNDIKSLSKLVRQGQEKSGNVIKYLIHSTKHDRRK